jgi:hypothetical protein
MFLVRDVFRCKPGQAKAGYLELVEGGHREIFRIV